MTSKNSARSRAYCFTINNHNDTDASQLQALCDSGKVKYLVAGKEVGEEGTPHIQGYCMFKSPTAFSTLKGFLSRAHIEVARGTPEENITYCTKDEDYIEFGDRPMTAKQAGEKGREYWETQLKAARENRLEDVDPKLQMSHWKNIVAIRDYYLKDLGNEYRPGIKNYWLHGPTRSGKSRAVREAFTDIYYKMANKWWENYGMQEVVLIEDLDKTHHVLGHHLKLWADNYPFRGEIKNHSVMARPKHIVVTSNYHPKDIWEDPGILEPILARFQVVQFPLPLGMKFKPVEDGAPLDPPSTLPMVDRESEYFSSPDYCGIHDIRHSVGGCPMCSPEVITGEEEVCRICAMRSGHLRTCELAPSHSSPQKKAKRKKLFE